MDDGVGMVQEWTENSSVLVQEGQGGSLPIFLSAFLI